jgi:hypothetical protein
MDTSAWLRDLFRTLDAMDATGFAEFLTADGCLHFANRPPVKGRVAVASAMSEFFASIGGLAHQIDETWEKPSSLVLEGRAVYLRRDGSRVMLPFANVFHLAGSAISDYRLYADLAPLYSAPRSA